MNPETDTKQRCGTCYYWKNGKCHKSPPTPEQGELGIFPKVGSMNWCGQWEPLPRKFKERPKLPKEEPIKSIYIESPTIWNPVKGLFRIFAGNRNTNKPKKEK